MRILVTQTGVKTDKNAVDTVANAVKCIKVVYRRLLDDQQISFNHRLYWEENLGIEITNLGWEEMYIKVLKLTNSTKLHFFQFRTINNYLITNVKLHKWKIKDSDLCTFCKEYRETILHLFFECEKVTTLWKLLYKWLYYFSFIELPLESSVIILNSYKGVFEGLVNTIILICKYYIYVQRCYDRELGFPALIGDIAKYKKVEKDIARNSGKLARHHKKWPMYDMV